MTFGWTWTVLGDNRTSMGGLVNRLEPLVGDRVKIQIPPAEHPALNPGMVHHLNGRAGQVVSIGQSDKIQVRFDEPAPAWWGYAGFCEQYAFDPSWLVKDEVAAWEDGQW